MLHRVTIAGLTMDPSSNAPIILLKAQDNRTIPIWIGLLEATSIAAALQEINFDRPMTHDLFRSFCDMTGVTLERVVICDIIDNTFYARVYFATPSQTFDMDARPSDAIALALRFQAPIFAAETVIESAGVEKEPGTAADRSEEGKKWAEYLKSLSPDDFGKYKM
jgi:bifunctional DNase/RNase